MRQSGMVPWWSPGIRTRSITWAADAPFPGENVFVVEKLLSGLITVENAASYVANTVVPGELVSIQGYGIRAADRRGFSRQ